MITHKRECGVGVQGSRPRPRARATGHATPLHLPSLRVASAQAGTERTTARGEMASATTTAAAVTRHTLLPPHSVAAVIDRVMRRNRRWSVEYRGSLSSHAVWLAVPMARMGSQEHDIAAAMDAYNERNAVPKAPGAARNDKQQRQLQDEPRVHGVADIDGADAGSLAAPGRIPLHDLDATVNAFFTGYDALLATFDAALAGEGAASDDLAQRRAAIARVVRAHLPRVTRGVGAGAFHPLLHVGAGVDACSPTTVAEGLAYMHARCWRDCDTAPAARFGTPLVDVVQTWCRRLCEDARYTAQVETAVATARDCGVQVGGFQARSRRLLQVLTLFHDTAGGTGPRAAAATGGTTLADDVEHAVVLAAAGVLATRSEFFMLHGLTSVWAVAAVGEGLGVIGDGAVVSSGSGDAATFHDLLHAWARGLVTTYLAGYPGAPAMLRDLVDVVGRCVAGGGDSSAIVAAVVSGTGPVPPPPQWDELLSLRHRDEHVLKAVWMLHTFSRTYPHHDGLFRATAAAVGDATATWPHIRKPDAPVGPWAFAAKL